jgi:GNAT superfamily N-acetyltransferase
MDLNNVVIRRAEVTDLAAILDLIVALAIFEKAEKEVVVTLDELVKDFNDGIFQSQVAEAEGGEILGMTLYYITYSTWKGKMMYLEDFVVKPSFRRLGIGHLLFDATITEAKRQDCKLMKWQVLDWNDSAIQFYKKYEATFEDDWYNVKLFFR